MSFRQDAGEVSKFSILTLIVCFILAVGFSVGGFTIYKIFNPLNEQVRYDTFKQSQAYNDKSAQDLSEMMERFSDPDTSIAQKQAMQALIKQRFASYDASKLPPALENFLTSQRGF